MQKEKEKIKGEVEKVEKKGRRGKFIKGRERNIGSSVKRKRKKKTKWVRKGGEKRERNVGVNK